MKRITISNDDFNHILTRLYENVEDALYYRLRKVYLSGESFTLEAHPAPPPFTIETLNQRLTDLEKRVSEQLEDLE